MLARISTPPTATVRTLAADDSPAQNAPPSQPLYPLLNSIAQNGAVSLRSLRKLAQRKKQLKPTVTFAGRGTTSFKMAY